MPLTTTWTWPVVSKCGCAFVSLTRPCVAQRVWPMPVVAGGGKTPTPPPPAAPAARGAGGVAVSRRRGALGDRLAQVVEVAHGADGLDRVAEDHGDPGRVVAAILEPGEPGQEQVLYGALTDISDDAAHAGAPFVQTTRSRAGRPRKGRSR